MDQKSFDHLTRLFSTAESRRAALRFVLGTILGGALVGHLSDPATLDAKSKQERRDGSKKDKDRDDKGRSENDRRNNRQQAQRKSNGRGKGDRQDRLASEAKGRKGRKGKSKGKARGKDKKNCARAGQAPKRDRRCCNGMVRDSAGLCAEPPTSPPADPCAGGNCPGPSPTCASTCSGCCQGETCRTDTGLDFCGQNGEPCKSCQCEFEACNGLCCDRGQTCCANQCVPGVCCETGDCPTQTCETKACVSNRCEYTRLTGQTDGTCNTICCNGACCPDGITTCTPTDDCGECEEPSNCPRPTTECRVATCQSGECGEAVAPDGAACSGGICCSGTCQIGNNCCTDAQCGGPGTNGPFCQSGRCVQCRTVADCTAPTDGTVTCFQGFCNKRCTNSLHRLCGSNRDRCQECCDDNTQCSSIHESSTCVSGACQCPSGWTRCGMECIDTRIEPNHCGNCTTACASGTCLNGICQDPEFCGTICTGPPTNRECEFFDCPSPENPEAPKECSGTVSNRTCTCPSGTVDCDGDGDCESCGRCGVSCPPNPRTNEPGFCCPGGFCSCDGKCDPGCEECWVTTIRDPEGSPVGTREHCDSGCVECWGQCCSACINGECASSGPISGGRIRR